jgi:hypothetical protein
VNSVLPDFVTAHLTLADLTELSQLASIQYIDLGRIHKPMLDVSVSEMRASLVHSGSINNTLYKGNGVILLIYERSTTIMMQVTELPPKQR